MKISEIIKWTVLAAIVYVFIFGSNIFNNIAKKAVDAALGLYSTLANALDGLLGSCTGCKNRKDLEGNPLTKEEACPGPGNLPFLNWKCAGGLVILAIIVLSVWKYIAGLLPKNDLVTQLSKESGNTDAQIYADYKDKANELINPFIHC